MDTRGGQKTSAFSRSKIRRRIFRSSAILATSLATFAPKAHVKAESKDFTKRLKESALTQPELGHSLSTGTADPPNHRGGRYPWKTEIVTTTFWIGEKPTKNNPTPNRASSWDSQWAQNYGGTDTPDPGQRRNFQPAAFTPRQNPFYVALPYNDVSHGAHKPEASQVVPWFKDEYKGPGVSVLKDRWIAIRHKGRTAYAQWEDCGPFRTDHSAYVFGNERPKPNLNKGAGLDVSPAVRDYLGMAETDVTDWKFVDYADVPRGPWAQLGNNNPFVLRQRIDKTRLAEAEPKRRVVQ